MEELRYCKKCDSKKPLTEEFWHHRNSKKDGWDVFCKSCVKIKTQQSYHRNKLNQKPYYDNYRLNNKEKTKEYHKIYYENNSEILKEKNKIKEPQMREYRRIRQNNKRKNDPLFNLRHSMGIMIYKSLKDKGYTKRSRTYEIIGCTFEEFKLHIEKQFKSWMTWENKGKYNGTYNFGWDIDHIIPISSAQSEKEMLELNHFSNLQPLCSKINRDEKRDNIYYHEEKLGIRQTRI